MSSEAVSGSPFPLFLAPLDEASGHEGSGRCALCRRDADDVFSLYGSDAVVYSCAGCGEPYPVPADEHDGATVTCPHCRVSAPAAVPREPATGCVDCLRAGRVALTKGTECGLVTWESAVRGQTGGIPEYALGEVGDFHVTPLDDEEDDERCVSVHVPSAVLFELLRTPGFPSWQELLWLFCCGNAMSFVGNWSRADLTEQVPGDAKAAFFKIYDGAAPWMWEEMDDDPDELGFYTFRCITCGRFRGHYDLS